MDPLGSSKWEKKFWEVPRLGKGWKTLIYAVNLRKTLDYMNRCEVKAKSLYLSMIIYLEEKPTDAVWGDIIWRLLWI